MDQIDITTLTVDDFIIKKSQSCRKCFFYQKIGGCVGNIEAKKLIYDLDDENGDCSRGHVYVLINKQVINQNGSN